MSVMSQAVWLFRYLRLFRTLRDVRLFRALRCGHITAGTEVALGLRAREPITLACRAGTSDVAVLWDTFFAGYHRPVAPLPAAPVILDLGANVGYTTVDLALRHPRACVLAVEMDAANAALAARNTVTLGSRCQVVRAAVWDENGEVTYNGDQAWSYRIDSRSNGVHSAPSVTIDTLLDQYNLHMVDYVKMDIEGAEARVLKSGASWLGRVRQICIEVHTPATCASCADSLSAAGFNCTPHPRHRHALVAVPLAADSGVRAGR